MRAKGKIIPKKTKKKLTAAEEFPERLEKKRQHIEIMANSMRSLRININKDLKEYINQK